MWRSKLRSVLKTHKLLIHLSKNLDVALLIEYDAVQDRHDVSITDGIRLSGILVDGRFFSFN